MKNMLRFTDDDSLEPLIQVLLAWRLWVVGLLAGALLGTLVYWVAPVPFRAAAVIVVDHNLEQAWPKEIDRQLFYYLDRETRKLESLAWSDAVFQTTGQKTGISLAPENLHLTLQKDGQWKFWAQASEPDTARKIARAWAESFVEIARAGVAQAAHIEAARQTLFAAQQAYLGAQLQCDRLAQILPLAEQDIGAWKITGDISVVQQWQLNEIAAWLNLEGTPLPQPENAAQQAEYWQTIDQLARVRLDACPAEISAGQQKLDALQSNLDTQLAGSAGLSPYLQLGNVEYVDTETAVPLAVFVFAGGLAGALGMILVTVLFSDRTERA